MNEGTKSYIEVAVISGAVSGAAGALVGWIINAIYPQMFPAVSAYPPLILFIVCGVSGGCGFGFGWWLRGKRMGAVSKRQQRKEDEAKRQEDEEERKREHERLVSRLIDYFNRLDFSDQQLLYKVYACNDKFEVPQGYDFYDSKIEGLLNIKKCSPTEERWMLKPEIRAFLDEHQELFEDVRRLEKSQSDNAW